MERALDRELTLDQEFALDEHLAQCERCRGRREGWEQLGSLFDRMPEPASDRVDLEAAVRGVRARVDGIGSVPGSTLGSDPLRPPFLGLARGRQSAAVAAAALALLAVGLGIRVIGVSDEDPVGPSETEVAERGGAGIEGEELPLQPKSHGNTGEGPGEPSGPNELDPDLDPELGAELASSSKLIQWPSVDGAPLSAIEVLPRAAGPLQSGRRDGVVADLRLALLDAYGELELAEDPGVRPLGPGDPAVPPVERFVERVDSATARHGRWPRERLVSGLLSDLIEERTVDLASPGSEVQVDREHLIAAAARYLGARGDAVSRRQLGEALGSMGGSVDGVAGEAIVAALLEGGDAGWGELEPRLTTRELRTEVLRQLATHPLEDRLQWLGSALTRADSARSPGFDGGGVDPEAARLAWGERQSDLAMGLRSCGSPAVHLLLDLVESGEIEAQELFNEYTWDPHAVAVLTSRAYELSRGRSLPGSRAEVLRRARGVLEVVAVSHPGGRLDWMFGYFGDDALRDRALEVVSGFDGGDAVDLVVALWDRRLVGAGELSAPLQDLLARNASIVLDRVRYTLEIGDVGAALDLCELCVAARHSALAPALIELCGSRLLPSEERMLAAESVGEVGSERDAEGLTANLRNLSRGERRVAALCLVSAHALAGDDVVREALAGASPQLIHQVLSMLHRRGAPGRSSASLVQLSRALEPLLESRRTQSRRNDL